MIFNVIHNILNNPRLDDGKKQMLAKSLKKTSIPLFILLLLVALYHFYYARKIIPGVVVGDTVVGGLTYDQAKSKLQASEKGLSQQVVYKFDGKEYKINAVDVGLKYDWDSTVSRAFEIGRSGNVIVDTKDKMAGLVKRLKLSAFYDYDDDLLNTRFMGIAAEVNIQTNDADVALKDNVPVITPSSSGQKVVEDSLYKIFVNSFDSMEFGSSDIPVIKVTPKIVDADLKPLLPTVEKMLKNNIQITSDKRSWTLTPQQLMDFVSFKKDGNKAKASLNDPQFDAFAVSIAQDVNELPRGQVTQTDGDKVTEFKITQEGRELDIEKFKSDFRDALLNVKPSVELSFKPISGPTDKERYGIYSLLGEGKSQFAHSIPGRVHNLTLASERTNGVLVAPGAVYSLNNAIGEVSGKTGYNAAYIIQNGRTVLGEGGGVCQVSTTLFRAVLNSGLPVVMRYPHAYRVGYYEQDSKPGFDASIFQPSLDFQFKNDTPNYILIQTSVDTDNMAMSFKIYGTPDGRKVEVSEPVITSQSPPPAPLYQDDPTLAKGVVRQVDYSAWGANVTFNRVVKKGDTILFEDKYTSRYQPWRAVYLVGTKQ